MTTVRPPSIPEHERVDVSRERITARIYAYRLLAAASDALTTGEPPQWPDPPTGHPYVLATVGAALGAMGRSALPRGYKFPKTNQHEEVPDVGPAED